MVAELLDLADRAAGIGDLRQARAEAARRTDNAERLEDEQREHDRRWVAGGRKAHAHDPVPDSDASRTREYSDLHAEVEVRARKAQLPQTALCGTGQGSDPYSLLFGIRSQA